MPVNDRRERRGRRAGRGLARRLALAVLFGGVAGPVGAESGYELWLRYLPSAGPERLAAYREAIPSFFVEAGDSPTRRVIAEELRRGLSGLLGRPTPQLDALSPEAGLVVAIGENSSALATVGGFEAVAELGEEGYWMRTVRGSRGWRTVIASAGEVGALYGTFNFLRLLETGSPISRLEVAQRPRIARRLLNHWDNLDGTIERGYAGRSLWRWEELPGALDPRLIDYARANASLGINGTVLNNVNANPQALDSGFLVKVAALADVFRPYGIQVYLSANFASPKVLGGLPSADPADPRVGEWWRRKAEEIYRLIPDFGGLLVKADSEGQPGPQDYGRTHAEGANLLADALAPHGGVVIWRAFVYDADVDPDRVKRSYLEFVPLDGAFRDNVLVQAKNGPLDFQPREPFHPLFGAMSKTPLVAELQITQEYLGHSTHLVYLAPMWKEFLEADTHVRGAGSTVARVVDGTLHDYRRTGIAGVANTGSDGNWTGHPFGQANWYAFGRLAWNPDLTAEEIADEWIRRTWSHEPEVIEVIRALMLDSRETYVRYTMPLGLHHLIGGDHYAPMPENPDPRRDDWSATYYHRADTSGVGFDRTESGSNAVGQYAEPLQKLWGNPETCPENLLLWFHRLPWDHRMRSGRTLWEEIVHHYERGAREAAEFPRRWEALRGRVDEERFAAVLAKLEKQAADAAAWRDHCVGYFGNKR
jgi:alpha-glucuronidase